MKVYRKDKNKVLKKDEKKYYSGSSNKAPKQSRVYPSGDKTYKSRF